MGNSFSKLKKNIKHRFARTKRNVDRPGAGGRGERVDAPGSLPRPEPPVVTGGNRKQEGNGSNAENETVEPSAASPPRPETGVVTGGDREQERNEPNAGDETVKPTAAGDEKESDWKSTASASAKLLLRGVRDSADAFGPLKSVAGGLCFVLENCEVRSPALSAVHKAHRCSANEGKQTSARIVGTPDQST